MQSLFSDRSIRSVWLGVLCAVLLRATAGAEPLVGAGPQADTGRAQLVSEQRSIVPGSTFLTALHIDLPAHWHTYWRFSGDSGATAKLRWTLPEGFSAGEILWPVPKRIPAGPFMEFGYEGEADLLIPILAPAHLAPDKPVALGLHAEWLVCSADVCIPRAADFSLQLGVAASAAGEADPDWGAALARAAESLPRPAPFETSFATGGGDVEIYAQDAQLAASLKSGSARTLEFYPYEDGLISHAAVQTIEIGARAAGLRVKAGPRLSQDAAPGAERPVNSLAAAPPGAERPVNSLAAAPPGVLHGLLVVERQDGRRDGFEIAAPRGARVAGLAPLASAGVNDGIATVAGLGTAIGFALLGGLILNLMPCVFPVLAMKVMGVVRRGGEAAPALRRHGWLYTAGVLASFLVLAAGLYLLRLGGAAIGWGYQLQSPIMVLLLAYLMFAVGLSLLGLLDFSLGAVGVGQSLAMQAGPFADFMTGVLATLVAAPCTAPFMGAALGYALVAPALQGGLVVVALGLGFALPYLALMHAPQAFKLLPKPGAWMARLKQFLAAPMLAATAWLMWVLAKEIGPLGLSAASAGLALIALAAWASQREAPGRAAVRRWFGRVAVILALAVPLTFVWLPAPAGTPPSGVTKPSSDGWAPYSRASLDAAVSAGQPVFVDLTAAWCLTCKVNEWGALASPRVTRAFDSAKVLRLKGDWTNRDPEITALLTEHGRIGVPLYLFFPGHGKATKILPQILTEAMVLEALKE
jgi:thiol:disulfide interchange protein DsbD